MGRSKKYKKNSKNDQDEQDREDRMLDLLEQKNKGKKVSSPLSKELTKNDRKEERTRLKSLMEKFNNG